MIYPKQPKVLLDPATGQQVVMRPNHSMFFIPAKAWTWILAVLAVPVAVMGFIGEGAARKEAGMPGYTEFKAADDLIDSKSKGEAHGNSEAATAAAGEFSTTMKTLTAAIFEGGSKKNFMTGGSFLTYCHDGAGSIVFLCHVPSLRSYKSEDAKAALDKVAWAAASEAAAKLDPDRKKSLSVGLRGVGSYGSIQQGKVGAESPDVLDSDAGKSVFYPAFAASIE